MLLMNKGRLGLLSRLSPVPKGRPELSPGRQSWLNSSGSSPVRGRLNPSHPFQPSLRDYSSLTAQPRTPSFGLRPGLSSDRPFSGLDNLSSHAHSKAVPPTLFITLGGQSLHCA